MISQKKLSIQSILVSVLQFFSVVLIAQNEPLKNTTATQQAPSEVVNLTTLETALQEAKQTENITQIANAYFDYTDFYLKTSDKMGISYCDSILLITKDLENNAKYPALAYKQKGRFYYRLGHYNLALDNFIKGLHHAKENTLLHATTNFNIGLIKNNIGEREEAKKIFRQYVRFMEEFQNKEPAKNYNLALFALSDSFAYTGQLDSATYYIDKGIKNCLLHQDMHTYRFFVLGSGIKSYFEKNFKDARDSLSKAKKLFTNHYDKTSLAISHLYLGKSKLAMNDYTMKHFIAVDSILEITNDVTPELLENYDDLRKHYKSVNDNKKHLHYINQQLKFDSILNTSYKDLVKNIVKNYDVEGLIEEKNDTIQELNKEMATSDTTIIVLLSLVLAFAGAMYYFFRKQVIHKKRFHKLLEEQQQKRQLADQSNKETPSADATIKELPEELVNDILAKLKKFEASTKFVKKKYTLPQLAKELNTNGTYLSKVINEVKQVNFSNYLNQLRIDYAVARITNDSRFREYTIKAIAEECGFKTQQSFSAAFYKKTGIKPSFFIRQLKNKIKNSNI
jgi:AraC-like DNA-binding protein